MQNKIIISVIIIIALVTISWNVKEMYSSNLVIKALKEDDFSKANELFQSATQYGKQSGFIEAYVNFITGFSKKIPDIVQEPSFFVEFSNAVSDSTKILENYINDHEEHNAKLYAKLGRAYYVGTLASIYALPIAQKQASQEVINKIQINIIVWAEKSEQAYLRGIELSPERVEYHRELILLYVAVENYDKAEKLVREAISYNPNFIELYNDLGLIYEARGEMNKAQRFYNLAN